MNPYNIISREKTLYFMQTNYKIVVISIYTRILGDSPSTQDRDKYISI